MDKFTILGIGNSGNNIVNYISDKLDKDNCDLACINTDKQLLEFSKTDCKLQIGKNTCASFGCGGQVSTGKSAAEESKDDIKNFLKDVKQLIIVSGFGGGCGTGASSVVAQYAVQMGIKTSCILTVPFSFEGKKRRDQALEGIELMKDVVNGKFILFYCSEILNNLEGKSVGLCEGFKLVDIKVYEVLKNHIDNNY